MQSLTVKSPAKINLALKIIRRRPDGYHELATLFHRVSLADSIMIKKRKEGFQLRCSNPALPVDEANIITKAYRVLQERVKNLGGAEVFLKKQIPVGAGLGGGSGNAAAFLVGMKKLYRLKISTAELLIMGSRLGADVPFFIHNINQGLGIGKGDKIQPLKTQTRHWFVLVASRQGLSTKEVYKNTIPPSKPLSLTKVSRAITMLSAFLEKRAYGQVEAFLENDLEHSAFRLRPSLRNVITRIKKQGAPLTRMTGSGPTVFSILPDFRSAKRLVKKLRRLLPSKQILLCHSF
jgi:4-diphosphocytidyl-2-C-methyl-D-erythritol kinase